MAIVKDSLTVFTYRFRLHDNAMARSNQAQMYFGL